MRYVPDTSFAASRSRITSLALLVAALCAAATSAAPRDGRWAIDRVCVPIGCFPGDAPGYPVEVTVPGSYVLTSDLDVSAEPAPTSTTAIFVSSAAVDLDLGGFALRGPVTCSGQPLACSEASGSGVGVTTAAGALGLRIHDGSISGFGAYGVSLQGDAARLERIRLTNHRLTAVLVYGIGGRLEQLVVNRNGGAGIFLPGAGGSVRDCSISDNGGSAIVAGAASNLEQNVATAVPVGSTAVAVGAGSRLGSSLVTGGSFGISTGDGALLLGNFSYSSALWQLSLGSGSAYSGIWMYNSANHYATGSGLSLGQNLCDISNC